MSSEDSRFPQASEWALASERGSRFALGLVVRLVRAFGSGPLGLLRAPCALYFTLFAGTARAASKSYLQRIRWANGEHGAPGFRDVFRHIYSFATALVDRVALWSGSFDDFDIQIHGSDHMLPLIEGKTGALLIGAHLGNFDVLRVLSRESNIPVNVLMYTVNAELINETFEALDPDCNVRIINLGSNSINTGFEIRRCVARGEFVAVLADRISPDSRNRVGYASFLGEQAAFPQGPLLLASVLGLPVVMTIALRTGPKKYDLHLQTISDGSRIPASERPKAIQQQIEAYAGWLEHYCLKAPLQWFNFYDFWAKAGANSK